MPLTLEVGYFNSYYMKRLAGKPDNTETVSGGNWQSPAVSVPEEDWYIEESRIRGGYNNTSTDLGVKAYIVEDNDDQKVRGSSLIYSGVINSRTGVNQSNQFSVGEDITRTLDPVNGSIQKLYAEDTNLIIFQERKVSRALIDKDQIYSAEGNPITTSSNLVIGQVLPYAGEYGISKNPESFAVYGYQKYFTDKNRNAVLRLSMDGITEISNYGMVSFFRNELNALDDTSKIIGSYDIYNKSYVLSMQSSVALDGYNTLSFDEAVNGWTSFYDFKPSFGFSSQGNYFTTNSNKLYKHYSNEDRTNFYGTRYNANVTLIVNPEPVERKTFQTISYEGSNGWRVLKVSSDETEAGSAEETGVIHSYNEGEYTDGGVTYRAGFDRKQNKYVASLKVDNGPSKLLLSKIILITSYIFIYFLYLVPTENNSFLPPGSVEPSTCISTFKK